METVFPSSPRDVVEETERIPATISGRDIANRKELCCGYLQHYHDPADSKGF